MTTPLPETTRKMKEIQQRQLEEYKKKKASLVAESEARNQRIKDRSAQYAKELVEEARKISEEKRKAEESGSFYVPAEAKVALVIRIRGINAMSPQARTILRLLRLRQKNNAVFVKLNKATTEMLRRVDTYIAYGYPTPEIVREIIYKRGCAELNKQVLPLTTNELVRVGLGHLGIESVDDLCHEIYTCGPNFTAANCFLAPFKLHPAVGGMRKITRHYVQGGDYGNREDLINDLVARMI